MTIVGSSRSQRESAGSRLDEVIAGYVRACEAGTPPEREALLAEHPDLADELRTFFEHRDRISALLTPLRDAARRALSIRCPHCHNSIELLEGDTSANILCPACGSNFSLTSPAGTAAPLRGKRLGPFQIIEQVGQGQFGTVWKARDLTLDRSVAIKVPRCRQMSSTETDVFLRDARVSAQLNHPNIVSVHEVGRHEETPYIVSDFVHGVSLKQWAAAHRPTIRAAVRLCATVATTLHYAHQAGVVHRDLKPGNIMMDLDDQPHIVDFGLAKRDVGEITMTLDGQILGTPAYMSPEQARGDAHHVDRRADIYSLGVILFELLTGELPFRGDKQMLLAQIIHDAPPSPRRLNGRVPRDLETICLKCLEKEPHRRFASAAALADDCQRFLDGQPVLARPISRAMHGWRWCRRNPWIAGLTAAVALLVVLTGVVGSVGYLSTERALGTARARAETIEQNLYYAEMYRAGIAAQDPDGLAQVRALVEKWRPIEGQIDRRGWEWYHLESLLHEDIATWHGHDSFVSSLAWSPDGSQLATAGGDGLVQIRRRSGRAAHSLTGHHGIVTDLAWAPAGTLLASAGHDGTVRIWDAVRGAPVKRLRHRGAVDAVSFSANGLRLATLSTGGTAERQAVSTVTFWRTESWEKEKELRLAAADYRYLCWNPRRSQLAAGSNQGRVVILDPTTGEQTHPCDDGGCIAWNHDGTLLACGQTDGLSVWNIAERKRIARSASRVSITFAAWHPREPWVAFPAGHKTVEIQDVARRERRFLLRGHLTPVRAACWHPRGHRVASGSVDGTIKIWNTARQGKRLAPGAAAIAWSPDGSRYASCRQASVVICDAETARIVHRFEGHRYPVFAVAWSPDGKCVASAGYDNAVRIWDLATGRAITSAKVQLSRNSRLARLPSVLAWSADSRRLAFLTTDNSIRIVESRGGRTICDLQGHSKRIRSLAWSPDGSRVVSAGQGDVVRFWDPRTGRCTKILGSAHTPCDVTTLDWSPDGSRIVTANGDTTVSIWDAAAGQPLRQLYGHTTYVQAVTWSPDGRRIASADESGCVHLWDARSGRRTLTLSYPSGVPMVAWSPDGQNLACVAYGGERTVRIWKAAPNRPQGPCW